MTLITKIKHLIIPHEGNEFKPHLIRHHYLNFYAFTSILFKLGFTLALFLLYPNAAYFSTVTSENIVTLVNEVRMENKLEPLAVSIKLETAASMKVEDMVNNDYFAHKSPDGVDPWFWFKRVKYLYTYAGENLGMGFADAESLVKAWMESEKHRKNILNPNYKEIGIAVKTGKIDGKETTIATQLFGTTYINGGEKNTAILDEPINIEINKVLGQTAGEETVVEIRGDDSNNIWTRVIAWGQIIFYVLLIILAILLFINIIVRIEIQHAPIIIHSFLLILVIGGLIIFHPHFLECAITEQVIKLI